MSKILENLLLKNKFLSNNNGIKNILAIQHLNYSRRKSSPSNGPFKVIQRDDNPFQKNNQMVDHLNYVLNWQLLAPKDFPFYLPGHIGLAYQNYSSSSSNLSSPTDTITNCVDLIKENEKRQLRMKCHVEQCPILLRNMVRELFSEKLFAKNSIITIVCLEYNQTDLIKSIRKNPHQKLEQIVQNFVMTGQLICLYLDSLGYWADFVNPFSGRPYFQSPIDESNKSASSSNIFNFQIIEQNNCKIILSSNIDNESTITRTFTGKIFTTAPLDNEYLKKLSKPSLIQF